MGHSHGQCCSSDSCCGSESKSCSCKCHQSQSGCKPSCGSEGKSCDMQSKFFELADHAWMEVLKEKIKENIKANSPNLDELAKIISEANHERWKKKMEDKKCCGSFEEKIHKFFDSSCSSSSCSTKK